MRTTSILQQPRLEAVAPFSYDFVQNSDYGVFSNSGSANVRASVQNVLSGGCSPADWQGFARGNIALMIRGNCTFQEKIAAAVSAGASAVLIYNSGGTGNAGKKTNWGKNFR